MVAIAEGIDIPINNLIAEGAAIFGIKGSGKSNTAAVMIEGLLDVGMPMTIIDPDGDYWGLREKYSLLVVGKSKQADTYIAGVKAPAMVNFSLHENLPVILDFSGEDDEAVQDYLEHYLKALFTICEEARKPYALIVEEAHELVPEGYRSDVSRLLTRIAKRGRKLGLFPISITQRPASISKNFVSQAGIAICHRVVNPADIQAYCGILPLKRAEVDERAKGLKQGEALIYWQSEVYERTIFERNTFHSGFTPTFEGNGHRSDIPALQRIDLSILEQLNTISDDTNVPNYEAIVAEKDREIAVLKKRIEELEMNGTPIREIKKNQRLLNRQKAAFTSLLNAVRKYSRPQKEVLRHLLIHEPESWNQVDMARRLGYQETTLKNLSYVGMLNDRLIKRDQGNYSSVASETLLQRFPELDFSEMFDNLMEVLGDE